MTAQWIKYDGSDKQIAELCKADKEFGFMALWKNGDYSGVIKNDWSGFDKDIDKYLICDPHSLADMICQQARTGQPVWWRSITGGGTGLCHENFPPFMHPVEFEYSFTPFGREV